MKGLDDQVRVFNRNTTIRDELSKNNGESLRLQKIKDDGVEKCFVYICKMPYKESYSESKEVSESDFLYLREQGVRNAFK